MDSNRVDPKKFQHAVNETLKDLEAAEKRLSPFMHLLAPGERSKYVKGKPDVMAAAPEMAARSKLHPAIVTTSEYDAEAVTEDLANLTTLQRLEAGLARLQQRLDDARLAWEAEVMVPTQHFYGAAQHAARTDGELAATIKPLRDAFSTPRRDAQKAAGEPSKSST